MATGAIAPFYSFSWGAGQCLLMCSTWPRQKQVMSSLGSLQFLIREGPLIPETFSNEFTIWPPHCLLLFTRLAFGRGCNCLRFTGLFCQHSGMPQNFLYFHVFNPSQLLQFHQDAIRKIAHEGHFDSLLEALSHVSNQSC